MKKILRLTLSGGNLGKHYVYVSEVTENVIKTVNNEICVSYYRRSDGVNRNPDCRRYWCIENLNNLEKFVQENGKEKNGVKVWNSGFKLRYNSRREEVNPKCLKLSSDQSYEDWFASMGYEVVNL